MITIRRSDDRGRTDWGWLDSRHSFSFGEYHDPSQMGFRSLRVLNDDRVAPGGGFGTHGHRDMEILSYVLSGALEHKDSMGTGAVVGPGKLQFMRAGSGVEHSEYNHSKTEPVHFLQVWIVPDRKGLTPAYGEKTLDPAAAAKDFVLMASPDGRDDSIRLHQDAELFITRLGAGDRRSYTLKPGRHAWLHVATGSITLNGQTLEAGDAAAVTDGETLELTGGSASELLLFDLA